MTSKKCNKCKIEKPLTEYSKNSLAVDNKRSQCKECDFLYQKKRDHTKDGLISRMYGNQLGRSRIRQHPKPDYTRDELYEWAISQPIFNELFCEWIKHGCKKHMTPSFDRNDDYKPYTLDNLTIMTWAENNKKGSDDEVNGVNNKRSISVVQLTLDGVLLKEFYSSKQAERETGIPNALIGRACKRKYGTSGGFRWEYQNK